jgi:hypothetical protein
LPAGDVDGPVETGFGLGSVLCRPNEQLLPHEPMDLRLPRSLASLLD